jgi:hypothetical protein
MSIMDQVKETPEGLWLSRDLHKRLGEIEVVEWPDAIVVRSRQTPAHELRDRAIEVLRQAGLLAELPWERVHPVSEEERVELASKLGRGRPLSELVIEEREASW